VNCIKNPGLIIAALHSVIIEFIMKFKTGLFIIKYQGINVAFLQKSNNDNYQE
jgi:hypothetical protein